MTGRCAPSTDMFCTATDYRVIDSPALVICSTYNSLLTALTAIYHALYSSAFKMRVEKNRIISKNASASMAAIRVFSQPRRSTNELSAHIRQSCALRCSVPFRSRSYDGCSDRYVV